jgi:transcription elongation factor Elf1
MTGKSDDITECPECGSKQLDRVSEPVEEVICSDCGLVVENSVMEESDRIDRSSNLESDITNLEGEKINRSKTGSGEWLADDPGIFVISSPDDTKQEFYRIDNPEDFFEDVSGGEEGAKRAIKHSDIDPFKTVELPYITWRFIS